MSRAVRRPPTHHARGGDVIKPRAADDFPTIRARLEELRRERECVEQRDEMNPCRRVRCRSERAELGRWPWPFAG
jgi:hypothetical protein